MLVLRLCRKLIACARCGATRPRWGCELCAVRGDREVHHRTAGEDSGQQHVARRFDLLAADALGGFAVAARERLHERFVLVLEVLWTFAQAETEVQETRHFVEQVLDRAGEPRVPGS